MIYTDGHWAHEIRQCMDLELTLADAPAPATAAPPNGMFVGGKNATADEDNPFDALVKKTKGAKKAEAAPKPADTEMLQLHMDTIGKLANIGVETPKTTADISGAIEKIKEKKKGLC